MSKLKRNLNLLLVILGLSMPVAYFIMGAGRGKMTSLFNKPPATTMISPLPMVFDSEDFMSYAELEVQDTFGHHSTVELTKKFIEELPATPHIKLHLARFVTFNHFLANDRGLAILFCQDRKSIKIINYLQRPNSAVIKLNERQIQCNPNGAI